ncbi:hypothetical protein V4E59_002502, partial [Proteus mirabilis]
MNQREKQFTDNLIEAVNNALAKRDARIDSLMEQLSLYQQLLQKQENDIAALLLLLEEQASASLNRLEQWFDAEKNSFEQSLHAFLIQQVKAIPMPKDGRDGKDGHSVTLEEIKPLVDSAINLAISALPKPLDGKDGKDGHSVTLEEIKPLVDSAVNSAISALPKPLDGKDGKDGHSVTLEEIKPLV